MHGWRNVTHCFCSPRWQSQIGPLRGSLSLIPMADPIFVLASSSQRLVSHDLRPSPAYSNITVTTQDRLMFTERLCLVDGSSFGMDVLVSD